MPNKYLLPFYEYVFGEEFSYSSFGKRLKMQKAVYLLQEMGVPISDYGFSWYKYGPYSQVLHDDAFSASNSNSAPDLSSLSVDNQKALLRLKEILTIPDISTYNDIQWCECVASIQYLRQNVLPRNSDDDDVLSRLVSIKPHLDDDISNKEALKRIKKYFE